MSNEKQTHIGCLIVRSVCGKQGPEIQREVERWISDCGPEWTVRRMKAINNAALHLKNGDRKMAQAVYQEHSISYHKDTMVPKGPWGFVVRKFVEARKPSVIRRWHAVLRFYTSLKLKPSQTTKAQVEKAVHNITDNAPVSAKGLAHPFFNGLFKSFQKRAKSQGVIVKPEKGKWSLDYSKYPVSLLNGTSYYHHGKSQVPQWYRKRPYGMFAFSWATNDWYPPGFDGPILNALGDQFINWDLGMPRRGDSPARVSLLQEQGCKARVVTQPSAKTQYVFLPLHDRLMKVIEKMYPKENCIKDQQKGMYLVCDHLEKGHDVYSVDLSAATDRFPRSFSIRLLEELGHHDFGQALEWLCQQDFDTDLTPSHKIRYKVGQPMGLYGSFPLFDLSNLVIADHCASMAPKTSSLRKYGNPVPFSNGSFFQVIGDDIVFSHKAVAELYSQTMKTLGVAISVQKSFAGRVAEFAGFVAVPSNKGYTAYRPYKVPAGSKITNGVEFLHALGSRVSKIGEYWNKRFEEYALTLGQRDISLSPLIRERDDYPPTYPKVSSSYLNSLFNVVYTNENAYSPYNDVPQTETYAESVRNVAPVLDERSMNFFKLEDYWSQHARQKHTVPGKPVNQISSDPLLKQARKSLSR